MNEQNELQDVFKYDVYVQQILDKAGWQPGRKCQKWAAKQKRRLEHKGFTVYLASMKVLEEFGEWTIGEQASMYVEPDTSAAVSLFKEYEILTKVELCPLGKDPKNEFTAFGCFLGKRA